MVDRFCQPFSSKNKGVLHALVTCASERFVDNLCARRPREELSRACSHCTQKGVQLDAPLTRASSCLELAPQELIRDLVVKLNLWDFDQAAQTPGATVGLHGFQVSEFLLHVAA